ncbi:MAG: N-acetyl-gamma-glutamyl-phosphate reductase [Actinobacteria bacterium]|nr:N-acetyl-gamma-glutamyl-phosphate reductase [Actinomycetota bacterium]
MNEKINIGIIGGSGYTGLELVKILKNHKYSNIIFLTSRTYKNKNISEVFPSIQDGNENGLVFKETASKNDYEKIDLLFLCLPPYESMEHVNNIEKNINLKIIDIGSDFRINDPELYKSWYGKEHILPVLLNDFVYGLPEINRDLIKKSSFIANPGCYPTSVLLGLAPLLKAGYKLDHISIDSKSGVSGAGRKLKEPYLFGSLNNNFYAYSPKNHRHIGEMEQEIKKISGYEYKIDFTPHLLPITRGIFSSIYCKTVQDHRDDFEEKIVSAYTDFYSDSIFVKVLKDNMPELKDVIGTNRCHIGISYDGRTSTLKIFSIIDNLLKGAAGQAVQNMNLMFGLEEGEGLVSDGIYS